MRPLIASLIATTVFAQAAFKPNAQLGVPARVGSIVKVTGTNEVLEQGNLRELTLASAELALTFPNRVENVVAKADEKLLILRGSLRNPEKTTVISLGPSAVIGLRLAARYTGTGKFTFVSHFDPATLQHVNHRLKGRESGEFVAVWRIPADFSDFRLGVISDKPLIVAWYDLTAHVGKLRGIFAAADGVGVNASAVVGARTAVEIDGLELAPGGVSRPARIAGAASDPSKPFHMVTLTATNRMLLPVRWGWQYWTAELIGADGSVTKAYPDLIDKATDRGWSGDLAAGASTTSQILFYPNGVVQPRALRLTFLATGRWVEMGLR